MSSSTGDRPHYRRRQDLEPFEPLNTALWVFDVDRHRMWWANSRALDFWSAESLDALLNRDFSSDSETVRTRLRQVVESPPGRGRIQEVWTLYPEGTPTTVIADIQPVLVADGRRAIMVEAGRALDFSEDPEALRMLEVARSSALMISSFTMSGELLIQNPASLSCYAYSDAQRERNDLSNRFVDPLIGARILAATRNGDHFDAELEVNTVAGVRVHKVLARKGRDPITGVFVTVLTEEDVTEQARLRVRLQHLNSELEERVGERTQRLQSVNEQLTREMEERRAAEEKLRHAQRMEAAGQLTGGIAHDFNNLLAVMIGNLELLEARIGRDDEQLGLVLRAAERSAELTQKLLAFSRQQPLHPQPVSLEPLVSNMTGLLAGTLGKAIRIKASASDGLSHALADRSQVENALLNLVLNARDAMPGGGEVIIECANARLGSDAASSDPEITPGDYVMLSVSDDGTGMPPQVCAQAFEPFFTTKEVGKHSGLGLSMVYGFAKQSGGHARITSEENRGTRVELYLPRARATPHSEFV